MSTEKTQPGRIDASVVDRPDSFGGRHHLPVWMGYLLFWACVSYTVFHLMVLNVYPIETWAFRIIHVAGGLVLGYALLVASASPARLKPVRSILEYLPMVVALIPALYALGAIVYAYGLRHGMGVMNPPPWLFKTFSQALIASVVLAIVASWFARKRRRALNWYYLSLILGCISVCGYLLFNLNAIQFRAGVMPTQPDYLTALAGVLLILELTRRVAGMALVVIAGVFIAYSFTGPYLPGFLQHSGYKFDRFFTYIYTDNGILGPTTAVSSTYIVLFITFAAFLQASKVGDYFVNFAFALAGRARGGPAKVAVFASGLMGMINGTSAGNVVATGSLTIPLMKRVGYRRRSAAAIEAAASSGGQIMPPIMGAGAFIMAEITGIPYTDLIVAALIPAVLYFASVYFMVDFEAKRVGLQGLPAHELPVVSQLLKKAYLFLPVVILIVALFMGYSVIRAGTTALVSAIVVSWLTNHRLGPRGTVNALEAAAKMSIQLIAVCACAGIIVGVIGLTGVGLRFSSLLLGLADASQLLALFFAMLISILLGMGMPTTAAYAVAAAVVAPGLIQMGITPLVAHFFVFYYAVMSAITPPVALAAYAGAAVAGSDPMRTSVAAFKIGLAAFIVPFMFFYSPSLLMVGEWTVVGRTLVTALIGVYLLAAAVQGYYFGIIAKPLRLVLLVGAVAMISGAFVTDLAGMTIAGALFVWQRKIAAGAKGDPASQS
jgi:TRAP transporter 4TM/12TM fusion protein